MKVTYKNHHKRQIEDRELLKFNHKTIDFTGTDPWRVLRIQAEIVEGFDALSKIGPGVSLFGSARLHEGTEYYEAARQTARHLAEHGLVVITGGGPGIMEAGNRGADEAGGMSVGLNIELPMEQTPNAWQNMSLEFRYFFVRKLMFVKYSVGYIIFPGGFGTLDELFESVTLSQTGKIEHFPIVLFGHAYWDGLLEWVKNTMLEAGCIDHDEMKMLHVTDDPAEAVHIIMREVRDKGYVVSDKKAL